MRWEKDGKNYFVGTTRHHAPQRSELQASVDTYDMTIYDIQEDDAGTYECHGKEYNNHKEIVDVVVVGMLCYSGFR